MNYQAVIRNNDGLIVKEDPVGMRISILRGSENGTLVYTETQRPSTNLNGLVSLEIGAGNTSDNFSNIDWSNGPYFIETEIDPEGGTNSTIIGTSQLLSVPYALYAGTIADNSVTSAKITDGTIATADLADGSVTSGKVADSTIATADLADGSVTSAKLAIGIVFSKIIELTGTTAPSGNWKEINYPAGFNSDNTRVLSFEISMSLDRWDNIAYTNGESNYPVSCTLLPGKIRLVFPSYAELHNKPFRLMLMLVP